MILTFCLKKVGLSVMTATWETLEKNTLFLFLAFHLNFRNYVLTYFSQPLRKRKISIK